MTGKTRITGATPAFYHPRCATNLRRYVRRTRSDHLTGNTIDLNSPELLGIGGMVIGQLRCKEPSCVHCRRLPARVACVIREKEHHKELSQSSNLNIHEASERCSAVLAHHETRLWCSSSSGNNCSWSSRFPFFCTSPPLARSYLGAKRLGEGGGGEGGHIILSGYRLR